MKYKSWLPKSIPILQLIKFLLKWGGFAQSITLENTLGQELKQFKVAPDTEYSTIELYFWRLPQGMYLLRFHYKEEKKIRIRKVVLRK